MKEDTIAELLKPRYKVIADYPQSIWKIGTILSLEIEHIDKTILGSLHKYPHLFKRLEWHEERGIEFLNQIKYVKVVVYRGYWLVGDIVPASLKINAMLKPIGYTLNDNHYQPLNELEPATKADYEAFINQNKKT